MKELISGMGKFAWGTIGGAGAAFVALFKVMGIFSTNKVKFNDQLIKRLEKVEDQYDTLRDRTDKCEEDRDKLNARINELENQIRTLQKQNGEQAGEISTLRDQGQTRSTELTKLMAERDAAIAERELLNKQLASGGGHLQLVKEVPASMAAPPVP